MDGGAAVGNTQTKPFLKLSSYLRYSSLPIPFLYSKVSKTKPIILDLEIKIWKYTSFSLDFRFGFGLILGSARLADCSCVMRPLWYDDDDFVRWICDRFCLIVLVLLWKSQAAIVCFCVCDFVWLVYLWCGSWRLSLMWEQFVFLWPCVLLMPW